MLIIVSMKNKLQTTSLLLNHGPADEELETVPEWVHIMPAGEFSAADGRGPFHLVDPEAVIARSMRPMVELPVDRDHELVFQGTSGSHKTAAGWIKEMEARADGIWARVEWLRWAKYQILAKEYRYISPVFLTAKDDGGAVIKILHISLCIDPALELNAIAASNFYNNLNNEEDEDDMDKKKLMAMAAALGLTIKDGDDLEVIVIAAAQAQTAELTALKENLDALREALGADKDADGAALVTAAQNLNTGAPEIDPTEYVPASMFRNVQKELKELRHATGEDKAVAAVNAAMASGKVAPGQKAWAMAYAKSNLDEFNQFVETAPVIVASGEADETKKQAAGGKSGLSETEMAVCSQLGLSPEKFLAVAENNNAQAVA